MNWDSLYQQLQELQAEVRVAEIHGHLCGRLVGGHVLLGASGQKIVEDVLNLPGGGESSVVTACLDLMEKSDKQLETSTFGFELLVPDDESELSVRLASLSDWCNGFLEGLGHTLAAAELNRNAEMREILGDLADIGNLSLDVEETNENEAYYTELYEYVRIAVMNLYSLFRTNAQDEAEEEGARH